MSDSPVTPNATQNIKEQCLTGSNVEEVLDYVKSEEGIPADMLRKTLIDSLSLLSIVQKKATEYGSLAETLRESNKQMKEIVESSQQREKEWSQLQIQVHVPQDETHEEEMESLRERMMLQRTDFENQITHLKRINAHLRRS